MARKRIIKREKFKKYFHATLCKIVGINKWWIIKCLTSYLFNQYWEWILTQAGYSSPHVFNIYLHFLESPSVIGTFVDGQTERNKNMAIA